jgi:hypothetical protein
MGNPEGIAQGERQGKRKPGQLHLLPGDPAVMGLEPFRPVTLRPHLSMGLPFAGQLQTR